MQHSPNAPKGLELTLELFKCEILKDKVKNYSEQEIQNLFRVAVGFSNALIHIFSKTKKSKSGC